MDYFHLRETETNTKNLTAETIGLLMRHINKQLKQLDRHGRMTNQIVLSHTVTTWASDRVSDLKSADCFFFSFLFFSFLFSSVSPTGSGARALISILCDQRWCDYERLCHRDCPDRTYTPG